MAGNGREDAERDSAALRRAVNNRARKPDHCGTPRCRGSVSVTYLGIDLCNLCYCRVLRERFPLDVPEPTPINPILGTTIGGVIR